MANTLLDAIRDRMGPGSQGISVPASNATEQTASLLRTKLTGQAPTISTDVPKRTNIAEQAAQDQARAGLAQAGTQAQIQSAQLGAQSADQEQAAKIAAEQDQAQMRAKESQAANQASQLLTDFARSGRQLSTQEDLSKLNQAAFAARLTNTQYIDTLQREAAKSGINDAASFNDAYYRQVFADSDALFRDKLDFNRMMGASDREFAKQMQDISLESAIQIASDASKEANTRALYTGVGNVVSGATQAGQAYYSKQGK